MKDAALVADRYDSLPERYGDYAREYAAGLDADVYPANWLRLQPILRRIREIRPKQILEVGCGEGTPAVMFAEAAGITVNHCIGIDISPKMVERARARGVNAYEADACDPKAVPWGFADVLTALGPICYMTRQEGDDFLDNVRKWLSPKGHAFIEHENDLFALFTRNWYTAEFLCRSIPRGSRFTFEVIQREHATLAVDQPMITFGDGGRLYMSDELDLPLTTKHDPTTLGRLYADHGLRLEAIRYYHFHAVPPKYEHLDPAEFRRLSLAMEDHDDPRGAFMASAFIAEATIL